MALARMWLTDQAGDLRLAGSAGAPTGGGIYNRLDGEFGRIARGAGKIGRIADTRAALVVRGIRGDEDWIANPGWVARQGVRAFLGYPLIAGDEVVGVMALFDRTMPPDGTLEDLQFLADYAAARIMDLREREAIYAQVPAFEEGPPNSLRVAPTVPVPAPSAPAFAPEPSVSFGAASPAFAPEPGASFGAASPAFAPEPGASFGAASAGIVTRAELREFEKRTILAALARTNGRVFGPRGAAALLRMKPTTLASRIKALGVG